MRLIYKSAYINKQHSFYCMSSKGVIAKHRLVMAEHLGRPLNHNEIVHHKDGNPKNNSLGNLTLVNVKQHFKATRIQQLQRRVIKLKIRLAEAELELYKRLEIG